MTRLKNADILTRHPGKQIMNKIIRTILSAMILIVMGGSPVLALSYEKEREIADNFITYLDNNNLIVYDQDITSTVQMIMNRLVDHIDSPVYPFKIHVVKDRSVNAFAIPDGHVFINLGTLLFVKDLDELAAVIGHELGHAQMRHISQQFETQKKISTATIVGIIAGTLLSAANPEAGAALLYSSMGGSENVRLAYSRRHEYEADEFGWNLLKAANMDPSAMTRFLTRMEALTGGVDAPEYLLTHPYTANRLASVSIDPGIPHPDKRYWTLYATVTGLMLDKDEATARAQTIPEPYRSLALGIMLTRKGSHEEALSLLNNIDLEPAYEYRGINLYYLGKPDEAYPYLKDHCKSAQAGIILAEILETKGQITTAISVLAPYQKQNPKVDYELGILYDKSSNPGLAHVSFARYFFKTNKPKAGLYHADKALEYEKDIGKDLAEEMKKMKKSMGKPDQS